MMIDWNTIRIFIKPGYIDFRKQINGLSLIVVNQMKQDIFSKTIFVFACRDRSKIKILYWDKNGFCLWLKRLEKDKFPWPDTTEQAKDITFDEFKMLLSGIDFFSAHQEIKEKKLI